MFGFYDLNVFDVLDVLDVFDVLDLAKVFFSEKISLIELHCHNV